MPTPTPRALLRLSGGKIPGAPPNFPTPPNLTPHESGLTARTEDDFAIAMRTGIDRSGGEIDPFMPLQNYAFLTDDELHAMRAYLQTVPALPEGER